MQSRCRRFSSMPQLQFLRLFNYSRSQRKLLKFGVWLAIATAARLTAAPPINGTKTNLVIGLLLPPEQSEAASLREGVILAVEQANTNVTMPVRAIIRGRSGQWGADAVEAARMVTDDEAAGLIAPTDGAATHLALQVAGRTAVPVVSLCPDSSVTRTGVPWMVRVVPSTVQEARFIFKALEAGSGKKRAAAVVPGGRAGREVAEDLLQASENTEFTLTKPFKKESSEKSAVGFAQQILKTKPDLILIWLDPIPAAVASKAMRQAGFTGALAGPGRLRSREFCERAGNALEGFVLPELVLDAASEVKSRAFQTGFRSRFGHQPDPTAAFSYDAAGLLIHILEMSNTPAAQAFPIRFCLPGASGTMKFETDGNRSADLRIVTTHRPDEQKSVTEGIR